MKFLLLFVIRFYRRWISPLFPPCCRYYPSCSGYALTAVTRFGAVKGSALAFFRLIRCHPWARGGIDEVPDVCTWKQVIYPAPTRKKENVSRETLGN